MKINVFSKSIGKMESKALQKLLDGDGVILDQIKLLFEGEFVSSAERSPTGGYVNFVKMKKLELPPNCPEDFEIGDVIMEIKPGVPTIGFLIAVRKSVPSYMEFYSFGDEKIDYNSLGTFLYIENLPESLSIKRKITEKSNVYL